MTNNSTMQSEWVSEAINICGSNHAMIKNCGGYAIFIKKVTDKFVAIKPQKGRRRRIKLKNFDKYCERFEMCFVKID